MEKLAESNPLAIVLQAWDIFNSKTIEFAEEKSKETFRSTISALTWIDINYKELDFLNLYYRIYSIKIKMEQTCRENLSKESAIEVSDIILSIVHDLEIETYNKTE
jgi:hypothetical protein